MKQGQLVPPSPELVRAVTTALSSNSSDYARETLTELLAGELAVCRAMPLEQRQAATKCAIVALLKTGAPENDHAVLKYSRPRRRRFRPKLARRSPRFWDQASWRRCASTAPRGFASSCAGHDRGSNAGRAAAKRFSPFCASRIR